MSGTFEVDEDHALLVAAKNTIGAVGGDLSTHQGTVTHGVTRAIADWKGPRNQTFTRAAGGVQIQLKASHQGCTDVAGVLGDYALAVAHTQTELDGFKRKHDAALTQAADSGSGSGTADLESEVHHRRAAQTYVDLALDAKRALATKTHTFASRIVEVTEKVAPASDHLTAAQIRREVTDAEGTGGTPAKDPGIRDALALLGGAVRAAPPDSVNPDGTVNWSKAGPGDTKVPKAGTDPYEVNAWWTSLSPAEQNKLLHDHPEKIGNLDGVPVTDRDFANRSALPGELAKLRAKMKDEFPDGEPWKDRSRYAGYDSGNVNVHNPDWDKWNDLKGRIDGTVDLRKRVDMKVQPPYYLIGFQPEVGNGRAIVSRGNPDTARNVSTMVPGTFSKLAKMDGDVTRSDKMRTSARKYTDDSVAAVTWVGYDAPQSIPVDASKMRFADNGAPLLRSFMTGLRTTHQGQPSHTTMVSHSYGTTLAGKTASGGLDVNDMVFVASPGVGVGSGWNSTGSVDDLHLDQESKGHVFATRSKSDPIKWSDDTVLGIDPLDVNFGDTLFGATPSGGHGDYWDSFNNPALVGFGQIIAGHGHDVKPPSDGQLPPRNTRDRNDLSPWLAP